MSFCTFSSLAFYRLLSLPRFFDPEELSLLIRDYKRERGESYFSGEDLGALLSKRNSPYDEKLFSRTDRGGLYWKELFFRVAVKVGMASIDWQNKEEMKGLWEDPLWGEKLEELYRGEIQREKELSLSSFEITQALLDIFHSEFRAQCEEVYSFFDQLLSKGFLPCSEFKEMENLQSQLRNLTQHKGITDSHKVYALGALRQEMSRFQGSVSVNSPQVLVFLTLLQQIKKNLDHFQAILFSLEEMQNSLQNLNSILGADKVPLVAYSDLTGLIWEHRRELKRTSLLTDLFFLEEITQTLQKNGWDTELFHLLPEKDDLYRLLLSYPSSFPDVVDAYETFYGFMREFFSSYSCLSKKGA